MYAPLWGGILGLIAITFHVIFTVGLLMIRVLVMFWIPFLIAEIVAQYWSDSDASLVLVAKFLARLPRFIFNMAYNIAHIWSIRSINMDLGDYSIFSWFRWITALSDYTGGFFGMVSLDHFPKLKDLNDPITLDTIAGPVLTLLSWFNRSVKPKMHPWWNRYLSNNELILKYTTSFKVNV